MAKRRRRRRRRKKKNKKKKKTKKGGGGRINRRLARARAAREKRSAERTRGGSEGVAAAGGADFSHRAGRIARGGIEAARAIARESSAGTSDVLGHARTTRSIKVGAVHPGARLPAPRQGRSAPRRGPGPPPCYGCGDERRVAPRIKDPRRPLKKVRARRGA
jgi:hypothetical protein